jgi:hypothetical protein
LEDKEVKVCDTTVARTHHRRGDLPPGAEAITPIELHLGRGLPQTFDAKITLRGIAWYRVRSGFGGRGDREDWIADLAVSVSVSDYHWNGSDFGPDYGSFESACAAQAIRALQIAKQKLADARFEMHIMHQCVSKLLALGIEDPEEEDGGDDV